MNKNVSEHFQLHSESATYHRLTDMIFFASHCIKPVVAQCPWTSVDGTESFFLPQLDGHWINGK